MFLKKKLQSATARLATPILRNCSGNVLLHSRRRKILQLRRIQKMKYKKYVMAIVMKSIEEEGWTDDEVPRYKRGVGETETAGCRSVCMKKDYLFLLCIGL